MSASSSLSRNDLRRIALAALVVLGLHAGLIWALQNSLVAPAPELIVPVSLLAPVPEASAQVAPTAASQPSQAKALAPAPAQPKPLTKSAPPKPDAAKANPSQTNTAPLASNTPATPNVATAATAATEASKPANATPSTSGASAQASEGAPAPSSAGTGTSATSAPAMPALQLPSSDADYLRNPKPVYPALSKRLNEQGTVIHSVLIAADGRPVSARLVKSSGFDRLDKAAYDAVMQWRYVPGKRQGVPEAMTFNVPIKWVLE